MATRWKLKAEEEAFQVTKDGPFAFHTFRHGEVYEAIPEEEKHRFESLDPDKTKVKEVKSK